MKRRKPSFEKAALIIKIIIAAISLAAATSKCRQRCEVKMALSENANQWRRNESIAGEAAARIDSNRGILTDDEANAI